LKVSVSESSDSAADNCHVYIDYREEFGGSGANHRLHHHAELVRRVEPRLVTILCGRYDPTILS
jgi:hypothetical protein